MFREICGIVILLIPILVNGQDCPVPNPPVNGKVNTTDGLTYGSVITYSCDTGYALVGSSSRICLIDTTWNGQTPTCNKECAVLASIPHGTVDLSLGNWADSVATYICDKNYALVGQSTRKCQATGLWSGVEPSCLFAMFPDILIVFGVLFILLIVIDIAALVVFLYKKVYLRKRNEEEETEDDEPEEKVEDQGKKLQFSPFMVERPGSAAFSHGHAHNRRSKYSRISPGPGVTEDPETLSRSPVHPPPRKPAIGHPKVEKIDLPTFVKTPRDKKSKTQLEHESDRFKPEMVLKPTMTGSIFPDKDNKQDGYNTGYRDDSHHKRAPSPAEADQLSLDEFDLPESKTGSRTYMPKSPFTASEA